MHSSFLSAENIPLKEKKKRQNKIKPFGKFDTINFPPRVYKFSMSL